MTRACSWSRGLTLIEILVSSALFGLFTGMVAGALILAHRTQDASVAKLDAVRRATIALELLARDIESARYESKVTMNAAPVPTVPTRPEDEFELQIRNNSRTLGKIVAGYWFDPGNNEPGKALIRRTLYDGYSASPLSPAYGENPDGRILVRDVKDFLLSSTSVAGVTSIKAQIWVRTIGNPITMTVATEQPVGP